MDINKIDKTLESNIKSLINNYRFANFTDDEINVIIKKSISHLNENQDKIINIVTKQINDYLYEKLNDNNNCLIIVNNYINDKCGIVNSYGDALNFFDDFNDFLMSLNFMLDPYIIKELMLKNSKLDSMLFLIVNHYLPSIIDGSFLSSYDNTLLLTSIDVYCEINQIETTDNINLDQVDVQESKKQFFKEIAKIPLLTADDERFYAQRIKYGDKQARKYFIECNLKLVVSIAKHYVNKGLDFMDLIQEGNIGLIKVVDKFDISKNTRFSTYATFCIRDSIKRAIVEKGRTIKLPSYATSQLSNIYRVSYVLEEKLGRKPSNDEIAKELNIPCEKVDRLFAISNDTVSVNDQLSEEIETELIDFIPSNDMSPEDAFFTNNTRKELEVIFNTAKLDQREREIISRRFGLKDGVIQSLETLGERFNITRERVRQIEAKAMRKLRNACILNKELNIASDHIQKIVNESTVRKTNYKSSFLPCFDIYNAQNEEMISISLSKVYDEVEVKEILSSLNTKSIAKIYSYLTMEQKTILSLFLASKKRFYSFSSFARIYSIDKDELDETINKVMAIYEYLLESNKNLTLKRINK